MPLTFEPGAFGHWRYSLGLDWAGKLVDRLNGGVKLGEYMEEHIFRPLGMKDTTFRPLHRRLTGQDVSKGCETGWRIGGRKYGSFSCP
jgi:CubicO group peptidase (beta-lactamase class C family)